MTSFTPQSAGAIPQMQQPQKKRLLSRRMVMVLLVVILMVIAGLVTANTTWRNKPWLVTAPDETVKGEPVDASSKNPTEISLDQLQNDWLSKVAVASSSSQEQLTQLSFVSFTMPSALRVKTTSGEIQTLQLDDETKIYQVEKYSLAKSGEIVGLSYGSPVNRLLLLHLAVGLPLSVSSQPSSKKIESVLIYPAKL